MSPANLKRDQDVRERAYFIWEREGRPKNRAEHHWRQALIEEQRLAEDLMPDEEKIIAGRADVNFPALLTKDVPGG